jgi:hypothetical protein
MTPLREQIAQLVVSVVFLLGFAAAVVVMLQNALATSNYGLVHEIFVSLSSLTTMVAGYWLGSSAGGARRDRMLADAQQALAVSTPPAVQPQNPQGEQ